MKTMQQQQQQQCSPWASLSIATTSKISPLPGCQPSRQSSRRRLQPSALPEWAVLAQMIQGAPSTTAATQNAVQNTLQNAPLGLQEAPERLLIAASLVAVAVGGYLLRNKLQK